MSAQEGRKQKPVPVTFRMDPSMTKTLDSLAERKGMNRSDFIRGIVEKILVPIKEEDTATAAAIAALPPGPKKKALRAVEIQKRLRELRAARPRVHALSSLFQDGDGAAQDAETVRLEAELAALGKAFEAEVGTGASALKTKKKGSELEVQTVQSMDGDEFTAECPLCEKEITVPGVEAGEVVDFNCSECDGELKTNEDEVWPAADGDEPPDEDEAEDGDEPPDEDEAEDGDEPPDEEPGPEKTAAEKEADLFLKVNALIKRLEACREPISRLDLWFSPLPACWLLKKELETMAANISKLDAKRLAELRGIVGRVVKLRTKIAELKAADAEASGTTIKKLEAELEAVAVELREAAEKRKAAAKGSGSSGWF